MDDLTTEARRPSQRSQVVARQPRVCPKSRLSPERSRKYVRSGMTPRANDLCLNPIQRSSSHQHLPPGRRGGVRGNRLSSSSSKQENNSSDSLNPSQTAMQNIDLFPDPLPKSLDLSNRRWRSSDKLDLSIPDGASLARDQHEQNGEGLVDSFRDRLHSEPSSVFLENRKHFSYAFVFSKNDSGMDYSQNEIQPLSPVSKTPLDTVQTAQSLVQSDDDLQPNTNVFQPPESTLPMSIQGHPFVLPMEEVPVPLTTTLLDAFVSPGSARSFSTRASETCLNNDNTLTTTTTSATTTSVTNSPTPQLPGAVKSAWQDIQTITVSPTEEQSAFKFSPRRRHSGNIDFRAAISHFNKRPHPLPKSKSSWRLQAAKARESVANLLSFAKTSKQKGKYEPGQGVGLEERKVSPRYNSSPCLGESENLSHNKSIFSLSQGDDQSVCQVKRRAGQLSRLKGMHWSNPELITSELRKDSQSRSEENNDIQFTDSNTFSKEIAQLDHVDITQRHSVNDGESTSSLTESSTTLVDNQGDDSDADSEVFEMQSKSDAAEVVEISQEEICDPLYESSNPNSNNIFNMSDNIPLAVANEGLSAEILSKPQDNTTSLEEAGGRNVELEIQTESPSATQAELEEMDTGQSSVIDENEFKTCSWLSSSIQQTLSSVQEHFNTEERSGLPRQEDSTDEVDLSTLVREEGAGVKKAKFCTTDETSDDSISYGMINTDLPAMLRSCDSELDSVVNNESLGNNNLNTNTNPNDRGSNTNNSDTKLTSNGLSVKNKTSETVQSMLSIDKQQFNTSSTSNTQMHHTSELNNILMRAKIHHRPDSRNRNSPQRKLGKAISETKDQQSERNDPQIVHHNINSNTNEGDVDQREVKSHEFPLSGTTPRGSQSTSTTTAIRNDTESASRQQDTPTISLPQENSSDLFKMFSADENSNENPCDSPGRVCLKTPISLTTMKQYWDNMNGNANLLSSLERSDSVTSLNSEISITSTRSEARGKRESSRRVEDLLSNKLFQKHLAKHTDTIERRVFCMHKRGIRKARSNFDLSTSQSAEMGIAINNFLNGGDINNNESVDNSDNDSSTNDNNSRSTISRSVSMLHKNNLGSPVSDVLTNVKENTETELNLQPKRRPFVKAATALNLHSVSSLDKPRLENLATDGDSRRKSLSCDDPTLQRLKQSNSDNDKDSSGKLLLNQRPRRLYIPSFKEFKRQKSETDITQVSENIPPVVGNAEVHSDIYVIQEDDNDIITKKEEDGSCKGHTVLDAKEDIPIRDSKPANKTSNSKRSNYGRSSAKNNKSPVFSHPAIVITSADIVDASITSPRHRLNRSKSESNMKKHRTSAQNIRSAVQRPQTPDIPNFSNSTSAMVPTFTAASANGVGDEQKFVTKMVKSESFHCQERNKDITRSFCEHVLSEKPNVNNSDNIKQGKHKKEIENKEYQPNDENINTSGCDLERRTNIQQHAMKDNHSKMKGKEENNCDNNLTDNDDDDRLSETNNDNNENSEDSDNEPLGFSASNLFLNRASHCETNTQDKHFSNDLNERSLQISNTALVKSNSLISGLDTLSAKADYLGGTQEFIPSSDSSLGFTSHTDVFLSSSKIQHGNKNDGRPSVGSLDSRMSGCTSTETLVDKPEESYDRDKSNNSFIGNTQSQAKFANIHNITEKAGTDKTSSIKECHNSPVKKFLFSDCVRDDVTARTDDVSKVDVTFLRRSPTSSASDSDQSSKTSVLRSTSDVSAVALDEREKRRRDRKDRPYKSDPFTGTNKLPQHSLTPDTGLYKVPSVSTSCSFPSLEELAEYSDSASLYEEEDEESRKRRHRLSNISTASEDSGLAGHTTNTCVQCDSYTADRTRKTSDGVAHTEYENAFVCKKCAMRVRERKETIQEIAETEKRYGRDLSVLKEEFCRPMKATSLLTLDQLDTIFINLEELVHVHKLFMAKLTTALVTAVKEGDEDFATVNIGSVFLESSTMFLAFENYCVNQAKSSALLEQLEKDKELLRVFLQVAQNENPKLRRMHLKSFLMVPVQRVMKYPLLLSRLHKVTPSYHGDKENIKQAQENIEDILEHINAKTYVHSGVKRRSLDLHGYSLSDKIEVNRVAIELLGWTKKDVCDVITSRLWYGQVPDPSWASKRARNVKFNMVRAVLLTNGRPVESPVSVSSSFEPSPVIQVAMVLVREKGGRYQVVRDPLFMDRCVVTVDPEYNHVFEIHEQSKDTYLFKAEHSRETTMWIKHLKQLSRNLGYWRRRRNGLPNIMLKTS